jgi:hypothetical protein
MSAIFFIISSRSVEASTRVVRKVVLTGSSPDNP